MSKSNALVRMSLTLGLITLVSLILSVLALSDIYQNIEPDLSLEWKVLRVSFLLVLMFIALASVTIIKQNR